MKHIALYRKWRPQQFCELVGQEPISQTMLNALKNERLAHAYLFCGPRGTGKTTTARLLAKALNCEDKSSNEPCNQCKNCQEITQGNSLDVIEIDAASNRGIDDARDLREKVRFSSVGGHYRIFIIDEFHMLTNEAFNALLKTLEEPPEKVIFVLATTEPHKILPTIISRCQRFDFQRISMPALVKHLAYVAKEEQIMLSQKAIQATARKSSGGLRDALSLLDQISTMALAGEEISDERVYQVLGLIEENSLFQLIEGLVARQAVPVLEMLKQLLEKGNEVSTIIRELLVLMRHIMVIQTGASQLEVLGIPSQLKERLKQCSEKMTANETVQLIEYLIQTFDRIQKVTQPEIWLEAELLKLCYLTQIPINGKTETIQQPVQPQQSQAQYQQQSVQPQQQPQRDRPSDTLSTPPEVGEGTNISAQEKVSVPLDNDNSFKLTPASSTPIATIRQDILNALKDIYPPGFALLSVGKFKHINDESRQVYITFTSPLHKAKLQEKHYRQHLNHALEQVLGQGFEVVIDIAKNESTPQKKTEIKPEVKAINESMQISPPSEPSLSKVVKVQEALVPPVPEEDKQGEAPSTLALPARKNSLNDVAELFKGKVIKLGS